MSRYSKINIKKNEKGIQKRTTAHYPEIPIRNDDIYVLTQDGDRFDQLANKYYQDSSLWWYIARANNMKFNNIEPGLTIRIPINVIYNKAEN